MMPRPPDTRTIPAGTTRAHIEWLTGQGATLRGIARASTVPYHVVQPLASGSTRRTSPAIADRILAVTPGQARRPPNRGGPGGSPTRITADRLDVLAARGDDVPTAAARLGVKTWSLRAWCARSSRACPADTRRALLARLERNGHERGRSAA